VSGEHVSAGAAGCRLPILLLIGWLAALGGTAAARQEENSIQQRPGFMDGFKDVTEGRFEAGIAKLKKVIEAYPDDPDVHMAYYNIACGYARAGDAEAGLQWLSQAYDHGYGCNTRHLERMQRDPDLEVLRPLPEFKALFERMKQRVQQIEQSWPEEKKAVVIVPSSYDKAKHYPMLVMLHPYGEYKATFAEKLKMVSENMGMILMCPTGDVLIAPKRLAWFTGVDDFLANFRAEQRMVWQDLERVRKEYSVDPERIYVAGYGQGATLAFTMGLRNPQQFAGALVIAGYYKMETVVEEWLPTSGGHALPVAILQPSGDSDQNVEQARNARDMLGTAGVNVHYVEYDGGRALPKDDAMAAALKWLLAQKKKPWKPTR
jgi:predicted esterase